MKKIIVFLLVLIALTANSQSIGDSGTLRARINQWVVPNSSQQITAQRLNLLLNGQLNVFGNMLSNIEDTGSSQWTKTGNNIVNKNIGNLTIKNANYPNGFFQTDASNRVAYLGDFNYQYDGVYEEINDATGQISFWAKDWNSVTPTTQFNGDGSGNISRGLVGWDNSGNLYGSSEYWYIPQNGDGAYIANPSNAGIYIGGYTTYLGLPWTNTNIKVDIDNEFQTFNSPNGFAFLEGNVGIATVSPVYPLDVIGTINASDQYRINGGKGLQGDGANYTELYSPNGNDGLVFYNNGFFLGNFVGNTLIDGSGTSMNYHNYAGDLIMTLSTDGTVFNGKITAPTISNAIGDKQLMYNSITGEFSYADTLNISNKLNASDSLDGGYYPYSSNPKGYLTTAEPTIAQNGTTKKYWTGYKTWGSINDSIRAAISLTTTGSGAATYNSSTGVINAPTATVGSIGAMDSIRFNNSGVLHTTPATFSKSGTTGVVTQTLATQSPNTFFGGGATGGSATPTFRSLVNADIPATLNGKTIGDSIYIPKIVGGTGINSGIDFYSSSNPASVNANDFNFYGWDGSGNRARKAYLQSTGGTGGSGVFHCNTITSIGSASISLESMAGSVQFAPAGTYCGAISYSSSIPTLIVTNGPANAGKICVGGNPAQSTAMFEMQSTTKGFLLPRMTSAQRTAISSPAVGLMVYQTDGTEGVYINKSGGWVFAF